MILSFLDERLVEYMLNILGIIVFDGLLFAHICVHLNIGMIQMNRSASLTLNFNRFACMAAICLVLLACMGCDRSVEKEENGYPVFHPYKMEVAFRGVDAEQTSNQKRQSTLEHAISLYSQEQYAWAARKFEENLQTSPNHLMSEFYGGVAYLACGKPLKAYPLLLDAAKDPDSFFEIHARWYLSIACLETQRLKQAKKLLQSLQNDSTQYSDQARQIMDKHPLLLCATDKMPVFVVKESLFIREDSSNVIVPQLRKEVEIVTSKDAKSLEVHFRKNFHAECMLKLYDDKGLLVHMERISNASKSAKAAISLSYKSSGIYSLLVQIVREKEDEIFPYKIRI